MCSKPTGLIYAPLSDIYMGGDISIYEVGPRDGLQNLEHTASIDDRVRLIECLADAGLQDIEFGSFVHPNRVPTMVGAGELFQRCADIDANLAALIPNNRGMRDAMAVGVEHFNIFFSPDEQFNKRNLGCYHDEIVASYSQMLTDIPSSQVRVYLSMAFSSPLSLLAKSITEAEYLGDTVVLCDTNGYASPDNMKQVLGLSHKHTALHLHYNTDKNQMFENITVAYESGVRDFDTSIAGLGGCPFVKGSRGNLGTGELISWAEQEGLDCGITLDDIKDAEKLAYSLSKREVLV